MIKNKTFFQTYFSDKIRPLTGQILTFWEKQDLKSEQDQKSIDAIGLAWRCCQCWFSDSFCWSSVGHLLAFCWSSVGHLLVICWSSVGHLSIICWSSVGLLFAFCLHSFGLLLVFCWYNCKDFKSSKLVNFR